MSISDIVRERESIVVVVQPLFMVNFGTLGPKFGGSQTSESLVRQVRIKRYRHIDIGDECCRFHQHHCHQSQLNYQYIIRQV